MKKTRLIYLPVLLFLTTSVFLASCNQNVVSQPEVKTPRTLDFSSVFTSILEAGTNSDLVYVVEPRFNNIVIDKNLLNAKTIADILPENATNGIVAYENVTVTVLENDHQFSDVTATNENEILNKAQKKILQELHYSESINVRANTSRRNEATGTLYGELLSYYITVVPEQQAQYSKGQEALILYLKEQSKEVVKIIEPEKVQSGKIKFTVTQTGKIAAVELVSTSGYDSVDEALMNIITNLPATWIPAKNSKGATVDQELIFFFGAQGC